MAFACCEQEEALLAYQVGFDLVENEMQAFLLKVRVPSYSTA